MEFVGKKIVERKELDKLEARVSALKRTIEDSKIIAQGGKEGLEKALEIFKNYRTWVQNKINDHYRNISVTRLIKVAELAGQEWALTMVISTFENSTTDADKRNPELQILEKELREWKKLPVR